ncbi:YCII-related protein [Cordyceps militaris CM01]|uniref:YCII-related protein n=2 Tax=Cordyceps militaris TaxID=73501 RepID=G3J4X7_CORMM|nr:YCII-related protein [Cordyceps militaris CM01]ATY65706.1 YCII-related protein [Cordyceps militaris]EGX95944.1 YCII-related protein [Cordyceps militaris CM01]
MPRFIFLVKATPMTEGLPGHTPPADIYERMAQYNADLTAAGAFVDAGGFKPTAAGYQVTFDGDNGASTQQGPFDVENEAHVSGFWIVQAGSADEALGWAKKIPFGRGGVTVRELRDN